MARFVNPFPQFLDDNGNPIVNGQLYFFKSGTNTPLITYADSQETIQNTHPVKLKANGRTPPIFYQGSARVQLVGDIPELGQVGVTIDVADPVGGENELGDFELWSSTVIYDAKDIVIGSDGNFYLSITEDNQGNDPTLSPSDWERITFLGFWNTNISYSLGNIVQTTDGYLWRSVVGGNVSNNPATDNGSNWLPAVDTANILVPTNTVIPKTGGGTLDALRINELQDAMTYDIPLANTVSANQVIIVTQPLQFASNEPTVQRSGADVIQINGSTDTDILFDQAGSRDIRLTSNGVDTWRLTV